MRTDVYIANVTPLYDDAMINQALSVASPQRAAKARRFYRRVDQALSLGAELLVRKALCDRGADDRELAYREGSNGKPSLAGHDDFHFNISHSGVYVMCAASPREVGCDVEEVTDIDLNIARRFFFNAEYDHIASAPTRKERELLFFRYWTLKESYMKVTGLGMSLELDAFQIAFDREGRPGVTPSLGGRHYRFTEYDDLDGYCCALCEVADNADAGYAPIPHWQRVDIAQLLTP